MDRHFDEELKELKEKLLKMASLAEEAIAQVMKALVERDEVLAKQVISADKPINNLEIEIDELALKLLALHHPMAKDLRRITSALKISNDLERIGDLAVNIAKRTIHLLTEPPLKPLIDIPRMAEHAQGMVKDSIDSYINKNADLARDVCRRDDIVDSSCEQIIRELLSYMTEDPKTTSRALDLIFIARHLERIADHATNIGEDVVYMVKGQNIKHHIAD